VIVPRLVLVTGPPASGKSTVAAAIADALGWPLFMKDDVKETLFDTVGIGDRDWSKALGNASLTLLTRIVRIELAAGRSVVAEGNFQWLDALPPARIVQVYCDGPLEVLKERYDERAAERHPGHLDQEGERPDFESYAPLALDGELVRFTVGDDVAALVEQVRACVA
jgi:predicted kinase